MSRRLGLPAVMAAAVVVAEAAAALLRPRDVGPGPVTADARDYFSDAELRHARRFRSGQRRLAAVRAAAELAVLVAAVRRAPAEGRNPVATGAATAAALAAASTAAGLPARAAARARARRVGLVTQSWAGWAGDLVKADAIATGVASGAGAALVLVHRRFGPHWWAPGAALAAAWSAAVSAAAPVLLDPLFNKFTPMPPGATREDVLALANAAGVDVGEVYEVDASRRTTGSNAYVTGLGATKRVVLYDTLLRDFAPEEVRLVVAHELAHVRFRDIHRQLTWLALCAPAGLAAVAQLAEALRREDATPVPATALALALVAPPLGFVANRMSRAIERRADHFALGLTGDPQALVEFERRIAVKNVMEPRPPAFERLLLATHPDTLERIGRALAQQPAFVLATEPTPRVP